MKKPDLSSFKTKKGITAIVFGAGSILGVFGYNFLTPEQTETLINAIMLMFSFL